MEHNNTYQKPTPKQENKKPLPRLIKDKATFKLTISDKCQKDIFELCANFPNREWSGVLFYTTEGDIDNIDTLKVNVEALFLEDIGTAAYTEYVVSEELAYFLMENPEYTTMNTGLIHSHNSMSAFFSGTDDTELVESAMNNPNNSVLSLIVNNQGPYTAAIGILTKMVTKGTRDIQITTLNGDIINKVETFDIISEVVYKYMAEVEHNSQLTARIKAVQSAQQPSPNYFNKGYGSYGDMFRNYDRADYHNQGTTSIVDTRSSWSKTPAVGSLFASEEITDYSKGVPFNYAISGTYKRMLEIIFKENIADRARFEKAFNLFIYRAITGSMEEEPKHLEVFMEMGQVCMEGVELPNEQEIVEKLQDFKGFNKLLKKQGIIKPINNLLKTAYLSKTGLLVAKLSTIARGTLSDDLAIFIEGLCDLIEKN